MTTSPDFGLPFIANQQNQPETTHNKAIAMLGALMKGVISLGDNAPPGSPTDGDTYVLGSAPTGAWAGKAHKIAIYLTNAWVFIPDVDSDGANIAMGARHYGLRVWVQDVGTPYIWNGFAWVPDTTLTLTADNIAIVPPPNAYASDVQGAMDEIYAAIQAILDAGIGGGGGVAASTANDISIDPIVDFYGANVQESLEELAGRLEVVESSNGSSGSSANGTAGSGVAIAGRLRVKMDTTTAYAWAWTKAAWQVVLEDTLTALTGGANTSLITVPAGIYFMRITGRFPTTTSANGYVTVVKGNTTSISVTNVIASDQGGSGGLPPYSRPQLATGWIAVTPGDTFNICLNPGQNSSSFTGDDGTSGEFTSMEIDWAQSIDLVGQLANTANNISIDPIIDFYGANVQEALEELAGRLAGLETSSISVARVVEYSGDLTIHAANANTEYARMTGTNPAIHVYVDFTETLPTDGEWTIRFQGTGTCTILPDSGVQLNPPYGGSFTLSRGMTITLKRVAIDEFDILGQTDAA